MLPDFSLAESLIKILYDYALPTNKEGAQSSYSEEIADTWADFISSGGGIIGEFPTLSGSKATELDCMKIIAEYCENINNFFLKPLSGLPIVDLIFRCGTRDLINLWAMYSGLQIARLPENQYTTICYSHPNKPPFGLDDATFPLPPGGTENYNFQITYSTSNPEHYISAITLSWNIEGEIFDASEYFSPPEGGEQIAAWNYEEIPIASDAIFLEARSAEFSKQWENA